METIIARQSIERRRRPYAAIARETRQPVSLFESLGNEASAKVARKKIVPSLGFEQGSSRVLTKQPSRLTRKIPALRRAKNNGSPPRWPADKSPYRDEKPRKSFFRQKMGFPMPKLGARKAIKRASPMKGFASALASSLVGALEALRKTAFGILMKVGRTKAEIRRPLATISLLQIPRPRASAKDAAATRARDFGPQAKLPRWFLALSLGLLALAAAIIGFRLLAEPVFPLPREGLLPAYEGNDDPAADLILAYLSPELAEQVDETSLGALPIPKSIEFSSYTVKAGDSIGSIAKRFGRSVDSIVSVNGVKNVKALKSGTILKIPNMDGVLHIVARGESLGKIAAIYKVDMTLLADANDLGSSTLKLGQSVFIPGARLKAEELKSIYGTATSWPVKGPISSYFGIRSDPFTGVRRFHSGLDIVVDTGTSVRAAADGRVEDLGYNANYGNYIIIDHGDGLKTLYGHLSAFCVGMGQRLSIGTVIAKSGNTGYSTGPHLHFGVYRRGVASDPLKFLR